MENTSPSSPEGSLKALKLIFFAMMLILIGGAVFLFVTIYERNQVKTKSQACAKGVMNLPVQEDIVKILQDGNVLTLLTKETKNKQQILILNYCTGKVIRSIMLHKSQEKGIEALKESYLDKPKKVKSIISKDDKDTQTRFLGGITVKDANQP